MTANQAVCCVDFQAQLIASSSVSEKVAVSITSKMTQFQSSLAVT